MFVIEKFLVLKVLVFLSCFLLSIKCSTGKWSDIRVVKINEQNELALELVIQWSIKEALLEVHRVGLVTVCIKPY